MGERNATPLNVWEELTHSYFLSFSSIIMLRFQKIMECSLIITRLIRILNLTPVNQLIWLKKSPSFLRKGRLIGQAMTGTTQQPIYICGNSTITILGCTNKLPPMITCLVEQAEHHNLLLGIFINLCMAIPKARTIP